MGKCLCDAELPALIGKVSGFVAVFIVHERTIYGVISEPLQTPRQGPRSMFFRGLGMSG